MILLSRVLFLLLAVSLLACEDDDVVRGTGPVITRTLDLPTVRGFDITGSGVVVTQGSPQEVTVEGQANLIDLLSTEVDDGIWRVRFTENVRNPEDFTVYVTLPDLDEVTISGSGALSNEQELNLDAIDLRITGSGSINLAGSVDQQTVVISASGSVNNFNLISREATATVSGSGVINVTTTEVLNATISGSGIIRYRGNPATVNQRVTGSGSISEG